MGRLRSGGSASSAYSIRRSVLHVRSTRGTDLSSPEDTTSSTVSPPAGSSESAPKEFSVEPHPIVENEPVSQEPLHTELTPVETVASVSPEEPPAEPAEGEAPALKTKPLPRVNAVAHEVRVKVTGARPGNGAGERELFTEATTTVLVFETGGVIRLAAAVTPGQLLFLCNEESKREVVAQVTRKRTYRPTECYVELEFSEPAPRFWGMEFSAATALLPKDAKELAAAEMVASAETTADELDEAAAPPSADQVLALKKEVDALRSQLNLLQAPLEAQQGVRWNAISDTVTQVIASAPQGAPASSASEKTASAFSIAPSLPTNPEAHSGNVGTVNPVSLPKPAFDYSFSLPKRRRSFRARGQFTPGFRTGVLRLAVLALALCVTLVGAAWYKHWLPWEQGAKQFPVASWPGGITTPVPGPKRPPGSPLSVEAGTAKAVLKNDVPAPANGASGGATLPSQSLGEAPAGIEHGIGSSARVEPMVQPPRRERSRAPALMTKRPASSPPPTTNMVDSAATSGSNSILVPPKLIKAQRAIASLDDLRDFETGNVVIDAIIDTAGNVTSMSVVTGPPSLRRPAMEALKNYKYQPATQNGKPVPAHVMVKIRFHFE